MTDTATDFTGFTAIDRTPDPSAFVRFLDAVSELRDFVSLKARVRSRLEPRPGERILDLGCGTGTDARWIAERVSPGGSVVGIDFSRAMVDVSRERSLGTGLPVEYLVGDAARLEFPDASFDGCTIDRVLIHMEQPEQAVAGVARVLRPGGRFVGFDIDFEAALIHGPDPAFARRMVDLGTEAYRNARIGRRLGSVLAGAGLEVVDLVPHGLLAPHWLCAGIFEGPVAEAVRSGSLGAGEADEWFATLETAEKEGRFFCAFQGFIFSARKPGD